MMERIPPNILFRPHPRDPEALKIHMVGEVPGPFNYDMFFGKRDNQLNRDQISKFAWSRLNHHVVSNNQLAPLSAYMYRKGWFVGHPLLDVDDPGTTLSVDRTVQVIYLACLEMDREFADGDKGAAMTLFGTTLSHIAWAMKPDGYLLINDAYVESSSVGITRRNRAHVVSRTRVTSNKRYMTIFHGWRANDKTASSSQYRLIYDYSLGTFKRRDVVNDMGLAPFIAQERAWKDIVVFCPYFYNNSYLQEALRTYLDNALVPHDAEIDPERLDHLAEGLGLAASMRMVPMSYSGPTKTIRFSLRAIPIGNGPTWMQESSAYPRWEGLVCWSLADLTAIKGPDGRPLRLTSVGDSGEDYE